MNASHGVPPGRTRAVASFLVATLAVLTVVGTGAGQVGSASPWRSAPSMPTPRSEMHAAYLDGTVYVPGGLGPDGTVDAFEALDVATGSWTVLPPLPEPVHHAGVTAAAGRIVVTGGYRDLEFRTDHAAVWAFDPDAAAWERMPDMPGPRAAHVTVTVDGVVHVIGGVGAASSEVWRLEVASGTWLEPAAPLPTPREHLAAAVVDGTVHVVGGRWPGRGNLGAHEAYDPDHDSWTPLPPLPTPRSGLTAGAVAGRIHVVGGEALDSSRTFSDHEVFDPGRNAWTRTEPLPSARHGIASAGPDDAWFVIGGATGAGWDTFTTLVDAVDVWDSTR